VIRDCPYDGTPMRHDLGPADDPDPAYGVRIESVQRCDTCGYEVAVHQDTWSDTEIRQRVAAFIATRGLGYEERVRVLRDQYGLEFGSRPC